MFQQVRKKQYWVDGDMHVACCSPATGALEEPEHGVDVDLRPKGREIMVTKAPAFASWLRLYGRGGPRLKLIPF